MTATVIDSLLPLDAEHRCDKCQARAVVEVVMVREHAVTEGDKAGELVTKTYDLKFCAHDYLVGAKKLEATATKIVRHPIPE